MTTVSPGQCIGHSINGNTGVVAFENVVSGPVSCGYDWRFAYFFTADREYGIHAVINTQGKEQHNTLVTGKISN